MTKQEAAIVSAYTGYLIGSFSDMHAYIEKIMRRPVFTHEMGDPDTRGAIRAASFGDFTNIEITP